MAKENPQGKKPPWKQRLKSAFNSVSRKELKAVFWDTAKDLKRPREIGILIVSSIVPGGWIGWAAYRFAKYRRKQKAANDNPPPAQDAKPPAAPKP